MSNESAPNDQSKCRELEEKLSVVERQLREQLLARGFDPDQDEHLALTAPLAKLYMERENLRTELEALKQSG